MKFLGISSATLQNEATIIFDESENLPTEKHRMPNQLAGPPGWPEIEISRIRSLFGKSMVESEVYPGAPGDPKKLMQPKYLEGFSHIHLACQGMANETHPFESAIFLEDASRFEDPVKRVLNGIAVLGGSITAAEVLNGWDLKAKLVALSACQTGVGSPKSSEVCLGFAPPLLGAGARSALLSLWAVEDSATTLFMIRFYENILGARVDLAKPLKKIEAVREAQTWLRQLKRSDLVRLTKELDMEYDIIPSEAAQGSNQDSPYADPFYWAPWVLAGDPN